MPLLSYEARFAEMVADGRKRQTIRAYRKDGRDPKPGDMLHHYTGPYRPGERVKIGASVCTRVLPFEIEVPKEHGVYWLLDGVVMIEDEIGEFAVDDGFTDPADMLRWMQANGGIAFNGLAIYWDDIALPPVAPGGGET